VPAGSSAVLANPAGAGAAARAEGRPPAAQLMYACIVLSLLVGIRTEEARALRWAHVDLAGDPAARPRVRPHVAVWRSVRVHGETKTEWSRRTLSCCNCVRVSSQITAAGRKANSQARSSRPVTSWPRFMSQEQRSGYLLLTGSADRDPPDEAEPAETRDDAFTSRFPRGCLGRRRGPAYYLAR
jgi:hypothetical protein